jgi:uncharacterized UBP type Zn finger protein
MPLSSVSHLFNITEEYLTLPNQESVELPSSISSLQELGYPLKTAYQAIVISDF